MPPPLPTIPLKYTISPSLEDYRISVQAFKDQNPGYRLLVGACVFHTPPDAPPKVLLIQRAAKDFLPNKWEIAGGTADDHEMVIEGAVRELWEEAGLRAKNVREVIGTYEWDDTYELPAGGIAGWKWRKLTFLVEIEGGDEAEVRSGTGDEAGGGKGTPVVTLDPEEHQAFVWATEEETMSDQAGEVALDWVSENQKGDILRGFERIKSMASA